MGKNLPKESHRLCLKRLRPSLWLDMDEVRQCFTMVVSRRRLVGSMHFQNLSKTRSPNLVFINSMKSVSKESTGRATITSSSYPDFQSKSESTKSERLSSTEKLAHFLSSRQQLVTRSSTLSQRYKFGVEHSRFV